MVRRGDIRLSPKHGVNPSMSVCFYCGKEDGTIVLPGMLKGDKQAPSKGVWSMEPCDGCKRWMEKGIILIAIENGQPESDNPRRSGRLCVMKEDAARRVFDGPMGEVLAKHRFGFIEDECWDLLGLSDVEPEQTEVT